LSNVFTWILGSDSDILLSSTSKQSLEPTQTPTQCASWSLKLGSNMHLVPTLRMYCHCPIHLYGLVIKHRNKFTFTCHSQHKLATYLSPPLFWRLFNPLDTKLNPICHLLALLGAHHFLHISRRILLLNVLCIALRTVVYQIARFLTKWLDAWVTEEMPEYLTE
jgi:hypothetical protein